MKNYKPGTIVPVGTKIVFTGHDGECTVGKVFTVTKNGSMGVFLEGEKHEQPVELFAPYKEEKEDIQSYETLPTYTTLKFIPGVSKGSVIVNEVQKGKGIKVMQYSPNFSESLSADYEDYIRWLLKEHPEDFKKIN